MWETILMGFLRRDGVRRPRCIPQRPGGVAPCRGWVAGAWEKWWRRGESNPRPNKSHNSVYVRSLALKDSPPPLPPDRATLVARILLVLAPPPGSPDLAPACYRRL